jgi:hypothetical protein
MYVVQLLLPLTPVQAVSGLASNLFWMNSPPGSGSDGVCQLASPGSLAKQRRH